MTTNKPEVAAYRYTASRSFGKRNQKWHYQESFPHASSREVAEIGRMEELIRLSDYEALQAECEELRKDAERYRWLRNHFRFAADSDCEIWFDRSLENSPANQLDAAIDAALAQEQGEKNGNV